MRKLAEGELDASSPAGRVGCHPVLRLFLVNLFVNVSGLGLVALGLYVLAG